MRKFLLLIFSVMVLNGVFATSISKPPKLKASEMFLPVGNTGSMISLLELSTIKMKDFENLTGKQLSLVEKLTLKGAQRQLRNNIDNDGTFNSKKVENFLRKRGNGEGFQAGGFFLGFLLGPIGIIIAYLINDDQKKNRVKWSWIGFGVYVALVLILLASGGLYFY